MALNSNALVTLADVRAFTGLTTEDVSDVKLEIYINAISQAIEKMTGRKLKAADYTVKYPGTDEQYLIMDQYPINSVTQVQYLIEEGSFYVFDPLEYEVLSEEGTLYNPRTWRKIGYSSYLSGDVDHPLRYIEVEYNAGFEEIPADLQMVVFQAIDDMVQVDDNGARVLKAFSISDTKWDWRDRGNDLFSASQMTVIKSYRKYRV